MTAAQIAEMMSLSDADVLTIAYLEAAGGDLPKALHHAVEDVLALEARAEAAARLVSAGYVRGALSINRD